MRECGACSRCCKLLDIPVLAKPGGKWCQHCKPGCGGCTIYDTRPDVCRKFACQWLIDPSFGDEWFPLHAKMFVYLDASVEPHLLRVVTDASALYRWREPPYRRRLAILSHRGLRNNTFHTVAQMRDRFWLITPSGDHEITGHAYVVNGTPHGWDVKWR